MFPLNESLLPTFPKHTQLQNRTLATQVPYPMVSVLTSPPIVAADERWSVSLMLVCWERGDAGDGITGLTPRAKAVPIKATVAERRNPGLLRSTRYQRTGLTNANVKDTWSVDVHGSFLCKALSLGWERVLGKQVILQLRRLFQRKPQCF